MSDDARVRTLLEEMLDSGLTPEAVCRDEPHLLPAVAEGWRRMRAFEAEVDVLFPTPTSTRADGPGRAPGAPAELPQVPGYLVESELGRGGMGIVHRAVHLRLGRPVALKMLLAGEFAAPEQLARFAREAEVVAGLRHANIVQVFDVGEFQGRPWFTMELVEGGSLAQKLAGTPQPARAAAALLVTLAQAMHVAHAGGIVHRDLKPSNILLTGDGEPKISDFGLARRLHGGAELTVSGAALGTPSYMAPEQALGKERLIGPAVDIYALGALLYEMLTGRPPFRGETAAETERQVISEEPVRPSRLNPKVPRDLETIVLKCLHKDPARRYDSALSLAEDVQRFLRGEPVAARPTGVGERAVKWVRRRPSQATALMGGVLLAITVLGALAWNGWQRAESERAVSAELRNAVQRMQVGEWVEARTAVERAKARLGDGGAPSLHDAVMRCEDDLALVARLDAVRMERVAVIDGYHDVRANNVRAHEAYDAAFRASGLLRDGDDPADFAARIAASAIAVALVPALDDWSVCAIHAPDPARQAWLLDAARRADPDPAGWRDRVRDALAWTDRDALEELAVTAVASGSSLPCLVALGERLMQAGGDAVPLLRDVQSRNPGDFWANFILGDALREEQPAEAIRFYQAAQSLRPDEVVTYNNLGLALALAGRLDESIAQFEKATQIDPTFAHAFSNLGNALQLSGRRDEAVVTFRQGLDVAPRSYSLRGNLAKVLYDLGRLDEALVEAESAVAIDPEYGTGRNALGVILRKLGRADEGVVHLREAARLQPERADVNANLSLAYLSQGRLDDALTEARLALEKDPLLAVAHSALCSILRAAGRFDEAIAHGREAVRLEPQDATHHNDLAAALAHARRFDEALVHAREAVRREPTSAVVQTNLGNALALSQRYSEAVEHFREAMHLQPDSAQAHGSLGLALMKLGRPREALPALVRAADLFPADAPVRAELQRQVTLCEALLALEDRVPEVIAGRDAPVDAHELSDFARLLHLQERYVLATRFHVAAFAANPSVLDDPHSAGRYNAACFAALAAAGHGDGAHPSTDDERATWRAQARAWLHAELDALEQALASGASSAGPLRERLTRSQHDEDLSGLRDDAALAALSADEAGECRRLWDRLASVLAAAERVP